MYGSRRLSLRSKSKAAMHHENRLKLTTMSEKHLPNTYQDWVRRSERLNQLGLGLGRKKYPYGFWPRVEGMPPAGLSTQESKKWLEEYNASRGSEVGSRHSLQTAGSRSLQSASGLDTDIG